MVIIAHMKRRAFWCLAMVLAAFGIVAAQTSSQTAPAGQPQFKVQIELVTIDTLVRDAKGHFVADLTKDEFAVYEDGAKQELSSVTLVRGGRVINLLAPLPPPAPEGIILPVLRTPTNDAAGRVFVFFVDDLHLQVHKTPRVRALFQQISKTLLHDEDMWAMVTTGPSAVAIDLSYGRGRLDEAIKKIMGSELSPTEIINAPPGSRGPIEVRHRAHVAFTTASELVRNLEKIHDRRKAVVYISDGYYFTPFQNARVNPDPGSPFAKNSGAALAAVIGALGSSPDGGASASQWHPDPNRGTANEEFADSDLARELADLTQAANRANVTIYPIDPRGVMDPLGDIGENVDQREWRQFVSKTQDTLRVLAHETGGIALLNQNEFDAGLKQIDAEASDYYVLGYYSKNPSAANRNRKIDVRVTRGGLTVWARSGRR